MTYLTRRDAITTAAASVVAAAVTGVAEAAEGVSSDLVAIYDELKRITALENAQPDLPWLPGYDKAEIERLARLWMATLHSMEDFPSRTAKDLHFKVEVLRDIFLRPENRDSSDWTEFADSKSDWLGKDIARLAGRQS
ncbi:hypothetical protein [Limibacillus sp. MBR-115]|jgi:hypothetical protein|uniref:hypothetical protein n=1 Tax=Limibacillus sp. MBR-115 TaxID=3156465 RepID=UPI0033972539